MAATASAQGIRMNVMSGASFLTNKDVTPAQPALELPATLTFESATANAAMFAPRAAGDPHKMAIGVTTGGGHRSRFSRPTVAPRRHPPDRHSTDPAGSAWFWTTSPRLIVYGRGRHGV